MFGYIRPLKGELKVKEYEQYKAVYCGLCHRLKQKYGFCARFVINFDFTFLAMLLGNNDESRYEFKRCGASPFKKKRCAVQTNGLEQAADFSVILYYWKLMDTARDETLIKRLGAYCASLLLRRAYKKAKANAPAFDGMVTRCLGELRELEAARSASIDETADKFAAILRCAADETGDDNSRRIMSQLFYHVGRIIYLLDAVDDLKDDYESGLYNPLIYRFELTSPELMPEDRNAMTITLAHSQAMLASAFALLDTGTYSDVLTNIIYDGLPWVAGRVFAGTWGKTEK